MTLSADLGLHVGEANPAPPEEGTVYGRDVAERGLISALIRHGPAKDILLAYSTPVLDPALAPRPAWLAAAIAARPDCHVRSIALQEIKKRGRPLNVGVWHDADANLAEAAGLRARFSTNIHPVTATVHVASYAGIVEHWVLPMMLQRLRPHDALICTSRAVRRAIEELVGVVDDRLAARLGARLGWSAQLPVIPLGVDTELFCPRDKRAARQQLALPLEGRLILWLGRISAIDKADLAPLLTACAPLLAQPAYHDVQLVIAGSGKPAEAARLKEYAAALRIADRVRFIEAPPEQRHLLHAAADIFVSPVDSLQETFGLTPIEAMACGVPQVVSDWDGYRDTVVEGETGFRISTYVADLEGEVEFAADLFSEYGLHDHLVWGQSTVIDAGIFRARLETLLAHPELRHELGERSRQRALAVYDWSVIARQYTELWTELREIARHEDRQDSLADDFSVPASFRAFSPYATRILDGGTWIAVGTADPSTIGHLLLRASLLDGNLITTLLDHLTGMGSAVTLADAESWAVRHSGVEAPVARRHLMWLLKQGFLQVTPSKSMEPG